MITLRLAFAFIFTFLATCAPQAWAQERSFQIVSLHPVLTEFAGELAGSAVTVVGLVQGGVDPHTFDPSPADARRLVRADLVLASGLGLESYLDKVLDTTGARPRLFLAGDALGGQLLNLEIHGHREADPHWWHSLAATRAVVLALTERLAQLRPADAPAIRARATVVLARLDALDQWARVTVATIPLARRQLVTTHDAFGYLARDHLFVVHPINGLSTESETSARHLAELITLIRREKISTVFAENIDNHRLIDQLVRETGVKLGGSLIADGLAPDGPAATYEGMIRQNLTTLADGLR